MTGALVDDPASGDIDGEGSPLRWHTSKIPQKPTSLSSSASSASSSSSSYSSQLSSLPRSGGDCDEEEQQVYVTCSSTIIICNEDDSKDYDDTYYPSYYNASTASSCGTYESAKMRSIYYEGDLQELQEISCYVEGADVEKEDEPVDHYEAIYEVINANEEVSEAEEEEYDDDDIDFNDSFDSDDSSEYCRLRPISTEEVYEESNYRAESFSSGLSKSMKNLKYIRQSSQPHSINKIAEAANSGMKKLKRNWSYTKHEVRTGLSKIKKKSTFSTHDMKSQENIYEETLPSSGSSDKGKWSFKSHFRRKLSSSSSTTDIPKELKPFSNKAKERPTFYLTLTIASDSQEELASSLSEDHQRKISAPSLPCLSLTSSDRPSKSKSTSNVPMRTVSARSLHGGLSRPKTAPPAPPASEKSKENDEEEEPEETSKDQLVLKLNQILSAGQIHPPGRRVLRSLDSPSLDYPSLSSPEEDRPKSLVNYASIHPPSRHSSCSIEPRFNIPKNRLSVSSSDDSEGYIRPSEIATSPPPLPARPLSGSNFIRRPLKIPSSETKSYLELNCGERTQNTITHSRFHDEPLYQFYTAKIERAALCQADCSSEDDYEVINDGTCKQEMKYSRPTAMELVTPSDGRRTLWCELPEVISSGILNKISGQERKIQEAIFEVITSEASYLKSLDILVTHFMNCPEFTADDETAVISRREAKVLFSDILPVKKFSEQFLDDLERRWQESVQISGITDIVLKHADSFNVYVKYCSNQIYQDRMLRYLKSNPRFLDVVNRLESSPVCQSLAMHSFLMLPMQRITRLPLLLDAIFNRLEYASSQWQECKAALTTLTKIVAECNEGARKMERMEEMLILSGQLDFREVRAMPLISASRWLVKKGELTRLTWRDSDTKLTFGRKISKHTLYFFLFSDLLVVTKKKHDDQYLVLDYCPRNMVQVLELENANRFPGRILEGYKNLLIMTMLQNHENRTVEMVLSCTLESDRTRWIEAVTPRTSENPDERVYEEWDCPQVQATHSYSAIQPDELSLEIADVINVLKKTSDGWFQGERIRDGEKGWFPGNHTTEIASAHVRARNLRQRYRLLVISGSFIKKEREEREDKKKERRKTVAAIESL